MALTINLNNNVTTSLLMIGCLFDPPGDNTSLFVEVAYNTEAKNVTIDLLSIAGNLVKGACRIKNTIFEIYIMSTI